MPVIVSFLSVALKVSIRGGNHAQSNPASGLDPAAANRFAPADQTDVNGPWSFGHVYICAYLPAFQEIDALRYNGLGCIPQNASRP